MKARTPRFSRGMTLIELMVVVIIATILVSIAVPSYIDQVRRSRRTEAKTALLDLAGREERYFSTSATGANYTAAPAALGISGAWPIQVGSNYYQVTVCTDAGPGTTPPCDPNPNAPTAPSFYILAIPVPGSPQDKDLQCRSFGVDSVGAQFATGSQTRDYCWGN